MRTYFIHTINKETEMKLSQNEVLLLHLKNGHSITSLDAQITFGIGRLASRIWDLSKQGHRIKKESVAVNKRYGGTAIVTRYSLEDK